MSDDERAHACAYCESAGWQRMHSGSWAELHGLVLAVCRDVEFDELGGIQRRFLTTTRSHDVSLIELRELPSDLVLKHGQHGSFEEGACLLEAVAWLAREPFSDHPSCACPVVAAFGRALNDRMPTDEMRTELLLPLAPLIAGSKSTPEVEARRRWMAADFAVREMAPHALCSAASMPDCKDPAALLAHAVVLRGLPPVTRDNWDAAAAAAFANAAFANAAFANAAAAAAAFAAFAAARAAAAFAAAAFANAAFANAAFAAFAAAADYAAADYAAARLEVFRCAADLLARMCAIAAS